MTVRIDPSTAMMFKIEEINKPWGRVRVRPVAAISTATHCSPRPIARRRTRRQLAVAQGSTRALRLEICPYRWCLSFGEFVLNIEDLDTGHLTI